METEELSINGSTLAYRQTSGRGNHIVFLHGMMDSSWSWDQYSGLLSRPGVAFDLPGFGDSTPRGSDSLRDWSDAVISGIQKLRISRFHLVGHSLGGALASQIADQRPQRVLSLSLIAPAGYGPIPLTDVLARREVETILAGTAPHAMRVRPLVRIAYRSLFSHGKGIDDELLERIVEGRQKSVQGTKEAMHILQKLHRNHFQENSFRGPAYALFGDHDHMTPSRDALPLIEEIFPDSETTVLENIGHHPQHEAPQETLEWIKTNTASKIKQERDASRKASVAL